MRSADWGLTPRQVLEAHKRQPAVEKRFEQLKTVHQIAPVFLKNEGRVEALFFLYFAALMVQALIERDLRKAMQRQGIEEIPIYPEERLCRRPTAQQVLRLFALSERHLLLHGRSVVRVFQPKMTGLQQKVLKLLAAPMSLYRQNDSLLP